MRFVFSAVAGWQWSVSFLQYSKESPSHMHTHILVLTSLHRAPSEVTRHRSQGSTAGPHGLSSPRAVKMSSLPLVFCGSTVMGLGGRVFASVCTFYWGFAEMLFLSFFFRATPVAYGGFQARSRIGAAAASLRHSHSHAGSKPPL